MILVIPCDDLERASARRLVGHEVTQILQEGLLLEQALHQHFQLQVLLRHSDPSRDTPRHEPLLIGGNGTNPCHRTIRDDADGVRFKELGNFVFVILNLVECREHIRLLVRRILQLDHCQREAIDESHHVGAHRFAALHGELIHDQPVIARNVGPVKHHNRYLAAVAILFDVHRNTVAQPDVEVAVGFDERLTGKLADALFSVLDSGGRKVWVQAL